MKWNNFRDELSYKYVSFLVKTLSPAESFLLKRLRKNTTDILNSSLDWLSGNREILEDMSDEDEWNDFYFHDSELEMLLISLFGHMNQRTVPLIESFYRQGASLGYSHMNKGFLFRDSDNESLNILKNYFGNVVDSINGEYITGIVDTIGRNITDNTIDNINNDLVDLVYTPIDNRFNIDTRCIFTAKTEYGRGVNTGLLQAYSNYGVDNYDWITTGLPNVCDKCKSIEGNGPYTLNEIINIGMVHPNCACSVKGRLQNNLHLKRNPVIIDLTGYKKY